MKAKDIIVWVAAIIAFLTGIGLCIAGFIVPPTGAISGSVLTATGEFLTFFGSVFGIGEFTKVKIEEIRNTKNKDEE
jgi:hypothetical protein